jgi:hypothetical protein
MTYLLRSEVSKSVKIHIEVLWVKIPYSWHVCITTSEKYSVSSFMEFSTLNVKIIYPFGTLTPTGLYGVITYRIQQ